MTDINRRKMIFAALALSACSGLALACDAQSTSPLARTASAAQTSRDRSRSGVGKPTIVLVHGAWADATGWQEVIPLLQQGGYEVAAEHRRSRTTSRDQASDQRDERGPWWSSVLTGRGRPAPPPAGTCRSPWTPVDPRGTRRASPTGGFLYIDACVFRDVFAECAERDTRVMAVAQKPIRRILGQSSTVAAWRTVPSGIWWLQDQAISRARTVHARRMGAKTTEIASCR
jgi:hypothetical protein